MRFINLIILASALCLAVPVYARESGGSPYRGADNSTDNSTGNVTDNSTDGDLFYMEDVDVRARVIRNDFTGRTEIPRELIRNMPAGNGGVTDMLQFAPGVQYDEMYRGSSSAGELSAPDVSISGGKTYDNLFVVDGMSNSNIMNPGQTSPYAKSDLPGSSQKYYVDSWIIEDITLYDSDISAAYDGFTGGVVSVNTIRPKNKFGGNITYRTTRSEWTHYFVGDRDARQLAGYMSSVQPRFRKNFVSTSVNIPLTARTGLIASYVYNSSEIPLLHFSEWKNQSRESHTALLKASHNIDGLTYIDATASYSPSYAKYYLKNAKGSDFTINSGGYYGIVNYVKESGGGGSLELHADYSYNISKRDAPDVYKSWIATKYKPWGAQIVDANGNISASNEGGMGSVEQQDRTLKLAVEQALEPVVFMGRHSVKYGAAYSNISGEYKRPHDGVEYSEASKSSDIDCNGDTQTCVAGDQYFTKRVITPASTVNAAINVYTAFAEDTWEISRVSARAGLRVTNDDYMRNTNLAPRLLLSFDATGSGNTVFTGGYNRYYTSNLLANKLQEGKRPSYAEKRWKIFNVATGWHESSENTPYSYKYKDLKTPYADELTAGITQMLYDTELGLRYMQRASRDEFATNREQIGTDGVYYYSLNNNGRSDYTSVQFRLHKTWRAHTVMFNATWQNTKTSNNNYNATFDLDEMEKVVFLDGKKVKLHELPRDNFNRPAVFNIAYYGRYFNHLTLAAMLKYETGYKQISLVNDNKLLGYGEIDPETGEPVQIVTDEYETRHLGDAVTLDVSVEWEQRFGAEQTLTLRIEVTNALNAKNKSGSLTRSDEYQLGRQLWASASYRF